MVDAIVSFVIERLGDLVLSEAGFLHGVENLVENAQIKLQCMSAFLKDADACVRNGDERVRLLVVQVRENSCALEDVIETYVFKVALDESAGGIRRVLKRSICIFRDKIDVHKVGSEIERISSNIDTWTSDLEKYGVQKSMDQAAEASSSYVRERRQLRQAYSYVEDNHVVGFQKDIEELVALLTEQKNPCKHKVVSVYGMGGLGKTTLARKVYQHPQVRTHFDCYAWASISQQCNRREVLEGILFAFTSSTDAERNHIKSLSDVELAKKLHDFQKQKKCLVLLDDIWTAKTWDLLKHAFPQGDTDSKILLTTRNKDVAVHVDRHGFIHEPHLLSDNESWDLFQNKYFCAGIHPSNSDSDDNERKKELAKEMLKKCAGLPLAIIVLAGLLSKKHTIYEWEQMKKNIVRCIGEGEQHEDSKYRSVWWVLGLSYSELPCHLKPCFLYLARYAEDAVIKVKELCLILIAEGFISLRGSCMETMEDVAYDCLSELVERSMIQVNETSLTGRIKSFGIHDLMRDLCVSKAQDENFLHFMDLRNKVKEPIESVYAAPITTNVRRVVIHYDKQSADNDFVQNIDGSLRCYIVHGQIVALEQRVLRRVCNHFLMLRVLIIDYKSDEVNTLKLPKEIGNLIHLRLFSIPNREIEKIPSCFGNFRCLQTLRVRTKSGTIPNSMYELRQLRHLYMLSLNGGAQIGEFLRSTKSKNLQTLVGIGTYFLVLSDLLQLQNLKKLKIRLDENFEAFLHNPQTLTFTHLMSLQVHKEVGVKIDIVPLILSCPQLHKLRLSLPVVRLPQFKQFSPNLVMLRLFNLRLEDDPMPTLEKLPKLKVLVIGSDSFMGDEMVCSRGGFDRLESLELRALKGLKEWKVEESALSRLGHLRIMGCRGLRRVPDGLRSISTLNDMLLRHMPKKFKERMEEGGEDFYKVKHITSRVFINCDTDYAYDYS
ncbi:putative disease resistance protein At1g50180 isoform X1 [Humulus lupulus]|uniref:putative disease resistance protein At1g50180 isoform X1 n=1 Tax=Humulus lupulus TaxID=3486 RepID=UPI002B411AFB|nr:putative disease resistance protein At1g50180 isoform X1 [Humulus lupulus]